MISAVAPIWDGNETWLVVSGVILWGAFPIVYSTLMSAFYLPVLLMLAGLILRGVAFEFRRKTERMRWIWNASFAGGSLVAAFMQGLMIGALVEGPAAHRRSLRWWRIRLAQSLCGALRHWTVRRLRAPRRLLAGQEMRR
jgi:cytochrome bd-type quinol oxidase subunit 2